MLGTLNISDASMGSGGRFKGSGNGGGKITISSLHNTVFFTAPGRLLAEGSSPRNATLGAGSGGSVAITAHSLQGAGNVSVAGGASLGGGGAGGGGRISVLVSRGHFVLIWSIEIRRSVRVCS